MPITETITIINNSGKIISTGKHLVGLFKEAKAAYKDRKVVLENERSIQRSYTSYDFPPAKSTYSRVPLPPPDHYYYEVQQRGGQSLADDNHNQNEQYYYYDNDVRSRASSQRSHRSHRSSRSDRTSRRPSRPALTIANLERLTDVSSVPPSQAPPPRNYQAPYAETVNKSMVLSRPDLARSPTAPANAGNGVYSGALDPSPLRDNMAVKHPPSEAPYLQHSHSDSSLPLQHAQELEGKKDIDMNLAYGSMPPDLATRVDLDPTEASKPADQVQDLVDKIEGLLDEAQCVHHSANAIISTLQESPERAAAVALALAELSSVLGKMTPAFAGFLKSGSPAVFGLLASPHFLIAAGVAVGVTIVMFGGWKIVKRIRDGKNAQAEKLAFEMGQMNINQTASEQQQAIPQPQMNQQYYQQEQQQEEQYYYDNPPFRHSSGEEARTEVSHDDAIVLEEMEELSTIETWRRGIVAFGEDESADMELISPQAERVMKQRYAEGREDEFHGDDRTIVADDSVSRAGGRRHRRRSHAPNSAAGSSSSRRSRSHAPPPLAHQNRPSRLREEVARSVASERTSASKKSKYKGSSRSRSKGEGEKRERERERERHNDDGDDTRSRYSSRSDRSSRSHRTSKTERSERTSRKPAGSAVTTGSKLRAIEDGTKDSGNTFASVFGFEKKKGDGSSVVTSSVGGGKDKEKKAANMLLKSIFKKKEKQEREKGGSRLVLEMA